MYNNMSECLELIDKANSLMQENKIDAAKQTFDKVLKIDSKNTLALLGKSLCFYRTGDFNIARRLAKKALDIDPQIIPQDYYEDLLLKTENKSSDVNSYSIMDLLKEASILMNQNKIKDAIIVFDNVLKRDSKNVTAIYGKSVCYYMNGDFHQALRLARNAILIDSNSIPDDYYNDLLSKTKDTNRSSRNNSSRNHNSTSSNEYVAKGLTLIRSKQFKKAMKNFDEVLKSEPNNVKAIVGKAYCLYNLGNDNLARRMCGDVWRSELKGVLVKYYDSIVMDKNNSSRNSSSSSSRRNYSGNSSNSSRNNNYSSESKIRNLMAKGLSDINNSFYNSALNSFDQILAIDSNNVKAIVCKAYCYYCLGNKNLANKLCNNVWRSQLKGKILKFYDTIIFNNDYNSNSSSDRRNVKSQLNTALNILSYGDYKTAKNMFDDILRDNPDNKNAIVGKAYCLNNMNQISLATRLCHDVFRYELSYDFAVLYDEIIIINNNSRNTNNSHRSNSSRSSNKPNQKNYSYSQIDQLCDEGFKHIDNYEIKDALISFKNVLKLDSNNVRAIEGQARCYYNLGYYVKALDECEKALSIDDSSIDYSFYRDVKNKANKFN